MDVETLANFTDVFTVVVIETRARHVYNTTMAILFTIHNDQSTHTSSEFYYLCC